MQKVTSGNYKLTQIKWNERHYWISIHETLQAVCSLWGYGGLHRIQKGMLQQIIYIDMSNSTIYSKLSAKHQQGLKHWEGFNLFAVVDSYYLVLYNDANLTNLSRDSVKRGLITKGIDVVNSVD